MQDFFQNFSITRLSNKRSIETSTNTGTKWTTRTHFMGQSNIMLDLNYSNVDLSRTLMKGLGSVHEKFRRLNYPKSNTVKFRK